MTWREFAAQIVIVSGLCVGACQLGSLATHHHASEPSPIRPTPTTERTSVTGSDRVIDLDIDPLAAVEAGPSVGPAWPDPSVIVLP